MGYILSDHTQGGIGPDGKKGQRLEWETIGCCHCNAVIKIIVTGCTKELETKFSCTKCHKPICRLCAEAMSVSHVCPGPVRAQIDRALALRDSLRSISKAL